MAEVMGNCIHDCFAFYLICFSGCETHFRKEIIMAVIKKESPGFLKSLKKNNNRDWFNKHKDQYLEANGNIAAFADALLMEMNKHDKIQTASGKKSLFRIYKDVRFSKVK